MQYFFVAEMVSLVHILYLDIIQKYFVEVTLLNLVASSFISSCRCYFSIKPADHILYILLVKRTNPNNVFFVTIGRYAEDKERISSSL